MSLRSFTHALQFLTRLPTPRAVGFDPQDIARSADWFPIVGALIGAAVATAAWGGAHVSPWVGGLAALVVWVAITGALHLDGLGDVADALGASHKNPDRFLEVLRDPHIGTFGVVAIALQITAKLVLLAECVRWDAFLPLVLVPAWARWGATVWSATVPPLAAGSGARFGATLNVPVIGLYGVALSAASLWAAPALLAALLVITAIALYWRWRTGGITGDCLGASIEVTETALLLLLVVAGTRA